jgi:hypothetical protein
MLVTPSGATEQTHDGVLSVLQCGSRWGAAVQEVRPGQPPTGELAHKL